MIIKGICGELLGGGAMIFGPLTAVPILIVFYSAITKWYTLAVHGVNVVQINLNNLHND